MKMIKNSNKKNVRGYCFSSDIENNGCVQVCHNNCLKVCINYSRKKDESKDK